MTVNKPNPYRIKVAVMANGERLPTLIRREDGMPLSRAVEVAA